MQHIKKNSPIEKILEEFEISFLNYDRLSIGDRKTVILFEKITPIIENILQSAYFLNGKKEKNNSIVFLEKIKEITNTFEEKNADCQRNIKLLQEAQLKNKEKV